MRTTIPILAGLAVFAAVSVQAGPSSPATMTSAELHSAPAMELIRQGCGWGWHRAHWRDRWGYWHWGHCVSNW